MVGIAQHEARDLYLDGVAAALKGKRTTAERLLRASLTLDPRNHQAWLWLAGVIAKPEESIECLKRVLELSPNNLYALEGLEWARQKLGNQPDIVSRDMASVAANQAGQADVNRSLLLTPTVLVSPKGTAF